MTTELLRGGGAAGLDTRNAKHLGLRVTRMLNKKSSVGSMVINLRKALLERLNEDQC